MSAGAAGWPEAFVKVLSKDEILNPGYLFSVFRDGSLYCKACGKLITGENREDHLEFHSQELDILYGEKAEKAAQSRTEGLRKAREARKTPIATPTVNHGPECPCEDCKEAF